MFLRLLMEKFAPEFLSFFLSELIVASTQFDSKSVFLFQIKSRREYLLKTF